MSLTFKPTRGIHDRETDEVYLYQDGDLQDKLAEGFERSAGIGGLKIVNGDFKYKGPNDSEFHDVGGGLPSDFIESGNIFCSLIDESGNYIVDENGNEVMGGMVYINYIKMYELESRVRKLESLISDVIRL